MRTSARDIEALQAEVKEQAPGISCRYITLQGEVDREVVAYSKEEEVDWIIMGTQGAGGLKKVFLGKLLQQRLN